VVGPEVHPASLGQRETFADVGATIAEYLGVMVNAGKSFLPQVAPWAGH